MIELDLEKLFEITEPESLDFEDELHRFAKLLRGNFELCSFFESQSILDMDKIKLMHEIQKESSARFQNFIKLILSNGLEKQFLKISRDFTSLVARKKSVVFAEVESAFPLSQDEKENLIEFIEGHVLIRENINQELIGGVRVLTSDGRFFDGSILGSLNKLKENLIHA